MTEIQCPKCNEWKPVEEFLSKTKRSIRAYCTSCWATYYRQRKYKDFPPPTKACELCGVVFNEKIKPHLDHDHATNKFRGWLCRKCNMALGLFKDSSSTLEKALEYLKP